MFSRLSQYFLCDSLQSMKSIFLRSGFGLFQCTDDIGGSVLKLGWSSLLRFTPVLLIVCCPFLSLIICTVLVFASNCATANFSSKMETCFAMQSVHKTHFCSCNMSKHEIKWNLYIWLTCNWTLMNTWTFFHINSSALWYLSTVKFFP